MEIEPAPSLRSPVTTDGAFAVLGNETRIRILDTLGVAEGPLSFSELRDRVGVADSGQFNYHLDKLDGVFVVKREEGYELLQPGRRVVEAIYAGVLTDELGVERIQVDHPCEHCGAPVDVRVAPGSIERYCTSCPGTYSRSSTSGRSRPTGRGYLGKLSLPPAGFQGRTAEEIYHAAQVWGHLEFLAIANGVCPRCSAAIERSVDPCTDHDADGDDLCHACGNRYQIAVRAECTNCIYEGMGGIGILTFGHPAVQAFKVNHGVNLVAPSPGDTPLSEREEEVLSIDPFAARITYQYHGDSLTLTVDEDLAVELVPAD